MAWVLTVLLALTIGFADSNSYLYNWKPDYEEEGITFDAGDIFLYNVVLSFIIATFQVVTDGEFYKELEIETISNSNKANNQDDGGKNIQLSNLADSALSHPVERSNLNSEVERLSLVTDTWSYYLTPNQNTWDACKEFGFLFQGLVNSIPLLLIPPYRSINFLYLFIVASLFIYRNL